MSDFHTNKKSQQLNLRYLGFCGVDDSVAPGLLELLSSRYPYIEWGILFRPDLEGSPRYASSDWVNQLLTIKSATGTKMNFAAHLCQSRCQELLEGEASFVTQLHHQGFHRVQINATAANGVCVDPTKLFDYIQNLRKIFNLFPQIEFILQQNNETCNLWKPFISDPPANISILFDASCGRGIALTTSSSTQYQVPYTTPAIPVGYAGGISPNNIQTILLNVANTTNGIETWIDMESSLRDILYDSSNRTEKDCFSIQKCYQCIQIVENVLTESKR